ncbi:MAG: protein jag [Ruminococcaceae bacterium]|nr:protein jag [Oscillospiraceae bacterium]
MMIKEITVTAKSIEEAVLKAAAELGAPNAEAIVYTVVEEPKKGFLGIGAVPAKITATYRAKGAAAAAQLIRALVDGMGIDATVTLVESDEKDENKLIRVEGEGAGALIGHHGDTLDSLQYLANLAANKKVAGEKRDFCRVTVDVENYRAKREETLRALARRKAEQVLRYKKSVMLEPMNPYERRIIHSEVQKIEGVSTNSIGSENNRKVVMYLDTEASATAAPRADFDEFAEF